MRSATARRDAGVWSSAQPPMRRQFIARAHELVAAGYARLDAASLMREEEPAITGRLCEAMNRYLRDAAAPGWCEMFAVHEDPPVGDSGKTGKRRDRVDIEIECTIRPRPVFSFEAKALRDSRSVSEYVGPDGLGCLCTGKYASRVDYAGMLGYVCAPGREAWIEKIERRLDSDRAAHGLADGHPVWTAVRVAEGLGDSLRSVHRREGLGLIEGPANAESRPTLIEVYHTFLICHEAS